MRSLSSASWSLAASRPCASWRASAGRGWLHVPRLAGTSPTSKCASAARHRPSGTATSHFRAVLPVESRKGSSRYAIMVSRFHSSMPLPTSVSTPCRGPGPPALAVTREQVPETPRSLRSSFIHRAFTEPRPSNLNSQRTESAEKSWQWLP